MYIYNILYKKYVLNHQANIIRRTKYIFLKLQFNIEVKSVFESANNEL